MGTANLAHAEARRRGESHSLLVTPLGDSASLRDVSGHGQEMGVVTQMGNQGHSGDGVRELWTGAIGQVGEAHVWTDRPYWENQGVRVAAERRT